MTTGRLMQNWHKRISRSSGPRWDISDYIWDISGYIWLGMLQIMLVNCYPNIAWSSPAELAQTSTPAKMSDKGLAELGDTASEEQLSLWIRQLDDDRYLVRETAQEHLIKAGIPALTIVSATAASKNASLESTARTVRILTTWSHTKETALQLAALESLASLDNHPTEAAMILEVLAVLHEKVAIESIKRLGGKCDLVRIARFGQTQVPAILGNQSPLHITIGSRWKGTDDDLKLIRKIRRTYIVSLHSAPIGAHALSLLTDIDNLKKVEIYGTHYSPSALASLRKVLPEKKQIDIRPSAAKLGIGGDEAQGGARISQVLKGTAADKAGLHPHDVIIKLGKEKVDNFQTLTQLIATHQPGEKIILTVIRGKSIAPGKARKDDKLTVPVILDRWGGASE